MDDEELAKLMREIDAMDGKAPVPAGSQSSQEVATRESGGKGRWVVVAAVGGGVIGFVLGSVLWFIPGVSGISTGIGAALGGALVALFGRPPRWLE
jgi:hypothetical protein